MTQNGTGWFLQLRADGRFPINQENGAPGGTLVDFVTSWKWGLHYQGLQHTAIMCSLNILGRAFWASRSDTTYLQSTILKGA